MVKSKVSQRLSSENMQTPNRVTNVEETTPRTLSLTHGATLSLTPLYSSAQRAASRGLSHIDFAKWIRETAGLDGLEPTNLFGDAPPPTMAGMYRHSDSHVWPGDMTTRDVTDPDNYQWYIQQLAQNKADKLYSTQMDIREANEHGGAPLGNDIMHGSRVVNLPKQRTDGVFTPIRQAAIDQGILRPTNRWREKAHLPHITSVFFCTFFYYWIFGGNFDYQFDYQFPLPDSRPVSLPRFSPLFLQKKIVFVLTL